MKKYFLIFPVFIFLGLEQAGGTPVPQDDFVGRAEKFKSLGLIPIAREQYLFLQKKYPKDKKKNLLN